MKNLVYIYIYTIHYIQIESVFTMNGGGTVYDEELCMYITDYEKVPGGAESLVITHQVIF